MGVRASTVKRELEQGRAIIADGSGWMQGALKDKDRYCAIGALYSFSSSTEARRLLNRASYELYGCCIADANDKIGLDAALSCYDWAIDQAGAGVVLP